jgi:hypothetical protein
LPLHDHKKCQFSAGGLVEVFFSDGLTARLHRECEAPYRRFLDEGHGPEGELEKAADDA